MYTYSQSTGELTQDGVFVGTGYSGTGAGRNKPGMEHVPDVGPIPQGRYKIGPARDDDAKLGPCVMNLDAEPGTDTFGRSLFRIHGNNKQNDASHGCIILGPAIRHQIRDGADKELTVVA